MGLFTPSKFELTTELMEKEAEVSELKREVKGLKEALNEAGNRKNTYGRNFSWADLKNMSRQELGQTPGSSATFVDFVFVLKERIKRLEDNTE